jgi:hypothetical protein
VTCLPLLVDRDLDASEVGDGFVPLREIVPRYGSAGWGSPFLRPSSPEHAIGALLPADADIFVRIGVSITPRMPCQNQSSLSWRDVTYLTR